MTATRQVVIVEGDDSPEVRALEQALEDEHVISGYLVLEGKTLSLPPSVRAGLRHLVSYLASGNQVSIGLAEQSYSLTEAANLLGIGQPQLTQLLESGALPRRIVDEEPQIAHDDLMAYRAKRRERRLQGVREIQQLSEEEGAYDRW